VKWIVVLLALAGLPVHAAEPRQMSWNDLSSLTGRNLRIVMPDGAVISGKATGVEAEALVLDIRKASQPAVYPKGEFRVPRASLKAFEIRGKSVHYRIIGTTLGSLAGLAGGAVAAWGIAWNDNRPHAAAAAFVGIWGGGTAGGYLLGNAADRKTTTVVVQP
jgi:hypothetical protein